MAGIAGLRLAVLVLSGVLAACSQQGPAVTQAQAAVDAPSGAVGERIYDDNCVPCHQRSGQGVAGVYPSLAASPVVLGDAGQLARWVIRGERPAAMPVGRFPTQMLRFGWMKQADAAALFTYLRSHFGNSAAPIDAATVAAALDK